LKDDAVPTLFDHNKDNRAPKRFEQELNTKSTQTMNFSNSVGTQTLSLLETKYTCIQTIETASDIGDNTSEYDEDDGIDEEPQ